MVHYTHSLEDMHKPRGQPESMLTEVHCNPWHAADGSARVH